MSEVAVETFQSRTREPEAPRDGLDSAAYALAGAAWSVGRRGRLLRHAKLIRERSKRAQELSRDALHSQLVEQAEWFRRHPVPDREHLTTALSLIAETAYRTLGRRPYVVQLMAALALHHGMLTEMKTGEGKTLAAGLAGVLAGWSGRPCHIVTTNDYLVSRDADQIAPLYDACGVSVGIVTADMDSAARRAGYGCAVTYATSKELLADFLRDRLVLEGRHEGARRLLAAIQAPDRHGAQALVMRGLGSAIVDEADSILIDEAVTPLIISAPNDSESLREAALAARSIANELVKGADYEVDFARRRVWLTEAGQDAVGGAADRLPEIWRGSVRREDLICLALSARELFRRDHDYVVVNGKVVIVDEFTGRMMPGRAWGTGLHQAIEAQEGVEVTSPLDVRARMSFQRFFRHYRRLSGLTGTAKNLGGEMWRVYGLAVVQIPTHRPCLRIMTPDRVYPDAARKWQAVVNAVCKRKGTGQPVLIGTRSIEESERLAGMLAEEGVTAQVLNALHHREEALIIQDAGEIGHVTIATNMAGRGTDIKLASGSTFLGGLHVIATERHEARRVDLQLFGRSARQGDVGSAEAILCLEDSLIRKFLPRPLAKALAPLCYIKGAGPILRFVFATLQDMAERSATAQRRRLLRSDQRMRDALAFAGPRE